MTSMTANPLHSDVIGPTNNSPIDEDDEHHNDDHHGDGHHEVVPPTRLPEWAQVN